jgi:hypothetical protein
MAQLWKALGLIALVVIGGGLILQRIVPASGPVLAVAGVVFSLATWIAPPVLLVIPRKPPKSSLAGVGFTIGLLAIACCLSTAALSFAMVTFAGGQSNHLAWFSLVATLAFWPSAFGLLYLGHRLTRQKRTARDPAANGGD